MEAGGETGEGAGLEKDCSIRGEEGEEGTVSAGRDGGLLGTGSEGVITGRKEGAWGAGVCCTVTEGWAGALLDWTGGAGREDCEAGREDWGEGRGAGREKVGVGRLNGLVIWGRVGRLRRGSWGILRVGREGSLKLSGGEAAKEGRRKGLSCLSSATGCGLRLGWLGLFLGCLGFLLFSSPSSCLLLDVCPFL